MSERWVRWVRRSAAWVLSISVLFALGCTSEADVGMQEYAPQSSDAAIKAVSLGTSDTNKFDPTRTGTKFPEGTKRVVVWYRWADAPDGAQVGIRWSRGGTVVLEQGEAFGKSSGSAAWFLQMSAGGDLPVGDYHVDLLENDQVVTTIPFHVGGPTAHS